MKPAPLLNPSFVWNSAASHGNSDAFRERQKARMRAAQSKPTENVRTIKRKAQP